jgi:hypothetical protein
VVVGRFVILVADRRPHGGLGDKQAAPGAEVILDGADGLLQDGGELGPVEIVGQRAAEIQQHGAGARAQALGFSYHGIAASMVGQLSGPTETPSS